MRQERRSMAIFDIKPVDQTGRVDLAKIEDLEPEINLRSKPSNKKANLLPIFSLPGLHTVEVKKNKSRDKSNDEIPEELVPHLVFEPIFPEPKTKEQLNKELEEELKKEQRVEAVLANVGGEINESSKFNPSVGGPSFKFRKGIILKRKKEESSILRELRQEQNVRTSNVLLSDQDPTLKEKSMRAEVSPTGREIEMWLERPRSNLFEDSRFDLGRKVQRTSDVKSFKLTTYSLLLIVLVLGGVFLWQSGFKLKNDVAEKGNQAVGNLEQAKVALGIFDFASAANNFSLAYENFSSASSNLNLLGSSLSSFLGDLPGLGKLKSAQNLSKAGENIAEAGKTLSLVADNFYRSNLASEKKSLLDYITPLKNSLVSAQGRVRLAGQLLAGIDDSVIPEEKKEAFLDFKSKLPDLENFVDEALNYAGFLSEIVGESGPKKYLVLFQNNTELRPTGGFIGSYALVDFSRGFLRELKVEDVYHTDGQAKKNIIPPKELQHITPNWGMRDANWFVNFPDSARKIMEFYTENDGGPLVDGVFSITPVIISKILEITGPIELAEYSRTIDSKNFLAEIQEEVEYGENREKPKQILVDFMPKFMEALGRQDKEKWLEIFKILVSGVEQKHILAYFKNALLEKAAADNGFSGEVRKTDGDFLMVVHSNVKGSKTDAVIDNAYELDSWISEDGFIEHSLRIKRKHNGGKTKLGFYNRTNYDFIRVLAPEGSTLSTLKGDYKANFKPLVDYGEVGGFVSDADLENYEESAKESGKTVFGFWIKTEPGETQEVILNYKTPVEVNGGEYALLVQKQPGTVDDEFNFIFQPPLRKKVTYKYPELDVQDGAVYFKGYLLKDLVIGLKLQ